MDWPKDKRWLVAKDEKETVSDELREQLREALRWDDVEGEEMILDAIMPVLAKHEAQQETREAFARRAYKRYLSGQGIDKSLTFTRFEIHPLVQACLDTREEK